MIYLSLLLMLLILSIYEKKKKKDFNLIFKLLFLILSFLLVFRYGQGTDYFGYYFNYIRAPSDFIDIFNADYIHGEIGWKFILYFFKSNNIDFTILVMIISIIEMTCIYRFINKYSKYKIITLLLFFPTYYLTYCFSALREGLVICLFLGFLLPLVTDEKTIKLRYKIIFLIGVLLLSLIHSCSIAFIVFLFAKKIENSKYKTFLLLFSTIIAILGYLGVYNIFLLSVSKNFGSSSSYIKGDILWKAIIIRIIYMILIHLLHKKNKVLKNSLENKLYSYYLTGFLLYLILSFSAILSSRLTVVFKMLETIIIPLEIYLLGNEKEKHTKNERTFSKESLFLMTLFVLIFVPIIETTKNIDAYINEGGYYSKNIIDYPYISIWDKDSIYTYRSKNYFLNN